jgi:hypothetical protein
MPYKTIYLLEANQHINIIMKFDKLFQEIYQQLELDFSNKKPKWALACGNLCDEMLKKYYPIKNMPKGNRRSIAFKKFWISVYNTLKGKGFTSDKMQSLGIPEYIINMYR